MKLKIEYCNMWNFLPSAIRLVDELMDDTNFRFDITEILLLPKSRGIFEVYVDDQLIFSKQELDRFPEKKEIPGLIRKLESF